LRWLPSASEEFCFPCLFTSQDEDVDSEEEIDADASENVNCDAEVFDDGMQESHAPTPNTSNLPHCSEYKTLYERNNMFLVDDQLHDDLAKVSVVKGIMDYALRANSNENQEQTPLVTSTDDELPVREIMIPMYGDGSPVEASHRIKDADRATGSNRYEKLRLFPGSFLFLLELHRMRGKFFADIFGLFVSKWRPYTGKTKWIMEPSDPNDIQAELPEYTLAHYRCALDCLSDKTV
jgi:hypothetical protein